VCIAVKSLAIAIKGKMAPTPTISMSEITIEITTKKAKNLLSWRVKIEKSLIKNNFTMTRLF
jgi:hypothetical protein